MTVARTRVGSVQCLLSRLPAVTDFFALSHGPSKVFRETCATDVLWSKSSHVASGSTNHFTLSLQDVVEHLLQLNVITKDFHLSSLQQFVESLTHIICMATGSKLLVNRE